MKKLLLPLMFATTAPILSADDAKPGDILQSINMFTPGEDSPRYKAVADARYGAQWNADLAFGCWGGKHSATDLALLHVQYNQRLLQNERQGGTWLRVEMSGSWALDPRSVSNADGMFDNGSATGSHADYFGTHRFVLPEVALMHYFAGKRACINVGMVNLANYLDAVSIANDSFANFAHGAFTNSSVLPLTDSNAGAVLQVEFSRKDFGMIALSRMGSGPGGNPFRSGPPGCCIVGEYGHVFQDPGVILRINPFYLHHQYGLAGSVEYEVDDRVALFARSGFGAGTGCAPGSTADCSCGATFKPIPSRPDDFIGIAYALTKEEIRQHTLELMYNFQVTDSLKLMPHAQFSPKGESLFGVQAVFSF